MTVGAINEFAQAGFELAGSTRVTIGQQVRSKLNDLSTNFALASEGKSLANLSFTTARPDNFTGKTDRFVVAKKFISRKNINQASFENSAAFEGKSLGNIGSGITFIKEQAFSSRRNNLFAVQQKLTSVKGQNFASFTNSVGGTAIGGSFLDMKV